MNIKKLIETIEAVHPGRYDCTFQELTAIRDAVGGEALEMGAYCFKYGFLKGQRAAQAPTGRKAEIMQYMREINSPASIARIYDYVYRLFLKEPQSETTHKEAAPDGL